jgi:hypothetical protein
MPRSSAWVLGAVLGISSILGQQISSPTEPDPFAGNYIIGNSAEVFAVWALPFGDPAPVQKVYDVEGFGLENVPDEILTTARHVSDAAHSSGGRRGMDAAAGDFNGDGFDDLIAAWEGEENSIVIMVPELVSGALDWTNAIHVTLTNVLAEGVCGSWAKFRLLPGNLDEDPDTELVLAYWAADRSLRICGYDTGGTLVPAETASLADEILDENEVGCSSARFDIALGDVDADGRAELILAGVERDPDTFVGWNIFVTVYDYRPGGDGISAAWTQTGRATTTWTDLNNSDYDVVRLAVVAGNFDEDTEHEAMLSFQIASSDKTTLFYLQTFEILTPSPDTLPWEITLQAGDEPDVPGRVLQGSTLGNQGWPLSLERGDLDNDGRDEVMVATRGEISAYAVDEMFLMPDPNGPPVRYLVPRKLGQSGYSSDASEDTHRVIALVDLDAEADLTAGSEPWRQELVVLENQMIDDDGDLMSLLNLRFIEVIPDVSGVQFRHLVSLSEEYSDMLAPRPAALAAADLDHSAVRLGPPAYSRRTDIVHPLVVLNAPPTHFDQLTGSICPDGFCDVNQCFPGANCPGMAVFERSVERTVEFSTELTADWAMSEEVKLGVDLAIEDIPIKAYAKWSTEYGERFSKTQRFTSRFTVEDRQTAQIDDFIYAVVVDYDVWEYPMYAQGQWLGNVLAVVPRVQQRRWFDSKSYSAQTYVPNHEVGNILSYAEIAQPEENDGLATPVRFTTADGRTLSNTGTGLWSLTEEGTEETTSEWALRETIQRPYDEYHGLNLSLGGLGGGTDFESTYSEEEIQTISSTVTDRQGTTVEFGNVDLGLGNVRYTVTPYVYWARNGAFVLDYSVQPEVALTGADVATFWDTHYGVRNPFGPMPDPAFILPWRYDPEKGLTLDEPALRQRTKDILFDPARPKAGQTVRIMARVHNWSLIDVGQPIEVRFYLGNPQDNGILLVDTNGVSSVVATSKTGQNLVARGEGFAEMTWRIPWSVDPAVRIYAVIDESNSIQELHEDNNLGWTVLAVEHPERPVISVARNGADIVVSWNGEGLVLQQAEDLNSSWETSNANILQLGTLHSATLSPSAGQTYFRLLDP